MIPIRQLKTGLYLYDKELADNFIVSTLTTVYVNKTGQKTRIIREDNLSKYMGISQEIVQKIINIGLLKEWFIYGNCANKVKV